MQLVMLRGILEMGLRLSAVRCCCFSVTFLVKLSQKKALLHVISDTCEGNVQK